MRTMYGQKIIDKKTTEEQMNMLGLKETLDWFATANGIRSHGHALRWDADSVLKVALDSEVNQEKAKTTKNHEEVEEETEKIGLKEDVLN